MTHTSTEQPEATPHQDLESGYPQPFIEWAKREKLWSESHGLVSHWRGLDIALKAWKASQARVPLSEYKQALDFLAGLHPGITIDGPPMAVAELIFDAVQAEQRALKEEIEKKERNLDWMRKEVMSFSEEEANSIKPGYIGQH